MSIAFAPVWVSRCWRKSVNKQNSQNCQAHQLENRRISTDDGSCAKEDPAQGAEKGGTMVAFPVDKRFHKKQQQSMLGRRGCVAQGYTLQRSAAQKGTLRFFQCLLAQGHTT